MNKILFSAIFILFAVKKTVERQNKMKRKEKIHKNCFHKVCY